MPGIPCCNNYSVNISSVDSGAIFNGIVNDTFIELDVPSPHQCSVYEVQVSAFNGLGEGEVLITKWSPGGDRVPYNNIHCKSQILCSRPICLFFYKVVLLTYIKLIILHAESM